jgi:hypothetical protein
MSQKEVKDIKEINKEIKDIKEFKEKKDQERQYVSDALVDALWSSYEALVSYTRQQSKDSENEWQQALGKALTWGKEQRQQVKTLSEEVVKKSSEVFFPEKSPLKPLAKQVEAIALTPLQFSFDLAEKIERVWEGDQKDFEKVQGERSTTWWKWHDSFVAAVKSQQRTFFRMMEDSTRFVARA